MPAHGALRQKGRSLQQGEDSAAASVADRQTKGDHVKKLYLIVGLLLIAVAAMTLAACGGSDEETTDGASGGGVFKIGYSADLSDGYSSYDTPVLQGVEFAIDEINEAGGINGLNKAVRRCDD